MRTWYAIVRMLYAEVIVSDRREGSHAMKIMTQRPNDERANSDVRDRTQRRWWRRPWVAPMAIVAVAFVAFSVPPYLTLDPSRSRIPPPADFTLYYPLLVAHVLFGSVAMLTSWVQVWPWLRRQHLTLHRRLGRVYVFGGVVPAGLIGLTIGAVSPFGVVLRASNVVLATVWLVVTVTGYRAARRDRFAEHRRWMIRSVVLTMSVITNRVWAVLGIVLLAPRLSTMFGGSETAMIQTIAGLSGWLGWVLPLLVVEWWLERPRTERVWGERSRLNPTT